MNLFCLISIWSWTKNWIDHWISGTLESHHNKQNLAVVVAAAAGKILRGTLKSRHAENFQECHLSLMWEFLNYPGSINRSQILFSGNIFIVLGAVRSSHAGSYLSGWLLFNMFLCCSVYCYVQNIESTKAKQRIECRLCSVKSRSSSDYWLALM